MLKESTLTKIAQLLKIDAAKLKEAITHKEEKDVEIDEKLQVFDDASLTARDRNKYNEGKTAGEEMLIKEAKRKHGIEVEGENIDKFVEALIGKAKKEANAKPDEKVTELEKQVNHWKNQHKELNDKLAETQRQYAEAAYDRELLGYFPKNRDGKFQDDEYLTLVKRSLQVKEVDGKRVIVKEGKELRNEKTFEPLSIKDAIDGYFNERKWVGEVTGGAAGAGAKGGGSGNSNPGGGAGKFSKLSQINAHLSENGIDPKGEKGQAFIHAAVKDNPNIDFQS